MSNIQAPSRTEIILFTDEQLATFHAFDIKAYQEGPIKRNYSEPVLKSGVLPILAPYLELKDLFNLVASTKNWDKEFKLNTLMNQFITMNDEQQIDNLIRCLQSLSPTQKTSISRLEVSRLMGFDTWELINQRSGNQLLYRRVSITHTDDLNKLIDLKNRHLDFLEELFIGPIEVSVAQILLITNRTPLLKKFTHLSPLKLNGPLFKRMIETLQEQRPQVEFHICQIGNL